MTTGAENVPDVVPPSERTDFTITLMRDQAGRNVLAWIGGTDLTSDWHATPEGALVALCEKARTFRNDLGARSAKTVREDGLESVYVWLSRVFG